MNMTRRRVLTNGLGFVLVGTTGLDKARWAKRVAGEPEADQAPPARPVATPAADPWRQLHRPLQVPRLAAGASCPRTGGRRINPDLSPAAGTGPAYAIGLGPDGVVSFDIAPTASGWYAAKILWVASPAYRGPVLVRGRQLGGTGEVGFGEGGGTAPQAELRLPAAAPHRRHREVYRAMSHRDGRSGHLPPTFAPRAAMPSKWTAQTSVR